MPLFAKTTWYRALAFKGRYLDIIAQTKDLLEDRPVGLAMGYWMGRDAPGALVAAAKKCRADRLLSKPFTSPIRRGISLAK